MLSKYFISCTFHFIPVGARLIKYEKHYMTAWDNGVFIYNEKGNTNKQY